MKILSFVLFAVFMFVSTADAQKWVRLAEFPGAHGRTPGRVGGRQALRVLRPRSGLEADGAGLRIRPCDRHVDEEEADAARLPPCLFHGGSRQDLRFRRLRAAAIRSPPAWVPIDNAWEYDPAEDSWKALAPVPTRRGWLVAVTAGDRIYVIGGLTPGPKEQQFLCRACIGRWGPLKNTIPPRIPGVSAARCPPLAITPPQAS